MSDFINEVKNEVILRLNENKGRIENIDDIGYVLTEKENTDGSWTYSRAKAWELMRNYLYEYAVFVGYYRSNFGEIPYFETEPDDYHHDIENVFCCMMIEAVDSAFRYAVNWVERNIEEYDHQGKIEINDDFINEIKKGLEDLEDVEDIW